MNLKKWLKGGAMKLFFLIIVMDVSLQSQLVLAESGMSGSGEELLSEETVTPVTPEMTTMPTAPATSLFLPYGVENNDSLAPPALDEAFGPVIMDVPVVIFQNRETSFYVSSNGLISAQEPYTQFEPMVFSREFTEFTHSIIAPFWADFDSGRQGSIYYRATRDSVILQQIVDMISDIDPMYGNYTPSQAFIATWEDIIPFNLEGFILYNFQAIMATDGRTSFAIFLYGDVSILNAIDSQTGFNSGDGVEFSNIQVSSISRVNVYRIDGICIEKITASAPNCLLLANSISFAFSCDLQQLTPDSCLCDSTASMSSDLCVPIGFIPFGPAVSDGIVSAAISRSEELQLKMPFPYYQSRENQLFISTNGVLTFRDVLPSFIISPVFPVSPVPLIAPLWADFDFRSQGNVFYRDTSHPEALIRARELVTNANEIYSDYSPVYAVVVTWSVARLLTNEISTPITFQAVLSTDGTSSFATFIYNEYLPRVLNNNIVSSGSGAIGFDAGDNSRYIRIASDTADSTLQFVNTFRIDGNCITNTSGEAVCNLNSTSLECMDNEFRALSCLCPPEFANNNKCQLTSFFPFGFGNYDTEGPRLVDGSALLSLGSDYDPIIYFTKAYTKIFISTNGFISFGEELTKNSYIPVPLPRTDMALGMLAPLWADFNFRNGGTLYYRIEQDEYILHVIANKLANQNPAYSSFHPTVAVVVTWFKSILIQNEIVISFQAVLATDGDISFALLLYEDYSSTLDVLLSFGIPYVSGFDAGDTVTSAQIVRNGNTTEFYYRIDGDCVTPLATDACGLNSIPLSCMERASTPTCLCKPDYNMSDTCSVLLRFSKRAGDGTIIRPQRTTGILQSTNLSLSTPVFLYGQQYWEIHVYVSGYISFGADTFLTSSCPFNLSSSPVPAISPVSLMADVNCVSETAAVLYYRVQPQQTDTQTPLSQQIDTPISISQQTDAQTLSQVAGRIGNFNPELASFQPLLAVVTTWQLRVNSTETTFVQSILVSDGNISFALFLYENPQEIATLLSQGILGFSAGNNSNVTQLEEIEDVNIFRIDGQCITSAAAGRVCGLNSVTAECDSLSATTCTCRPGYKLDAMDNFMCRDINECTEGLHDCSQTCTNTDGGFTCSCDRGYRQLSDNITICEDIDECLEKPCSHFCSNFDGGFFCSCPSGLEINLLRVTCIDIDECAAELDNCSQTCTNTEKGYLCSCRAGYLLNDDGKTCTESSLSDGVSGRELALSLILPIFFILIVTSIAIVLVVIHRNRKKTSLVSSADQMYEIENLNPYIRHPDITVESSYSPNIPQRFLIASSKLTIGPSIGQGEFGVVYKGDLQHNYADNVRDAVAVKTLKGFVQRARVRELLMECAKMQKFDHPNVLKLIGVCLDGGPAPYIIMPFMANGSLLSYIKKQRDNLIVDPEPTTYFDIVSVEKKLLDMCLQVAKGMEYLASKRVVHRDLAARNCMIDVNLVIKVADFGLAESVDISKNYFRQTQKDVVRLPIKWLAPESINDTVFSEKSDVWSYGVTCWEVFSGGKTPYPGIHAMDLPHQLDNGMRLEKPLNAACTDEIYTMMMCCFHSDADQRPDFSELVNSVSSILVAVAGYVEFFPRTDSLIPNPDS